MTDPRFLEIARHSTAWPKCYRNYFAAEPGSPDYATLERMVLDGWATVGKKIDGGLLIFHMTEKAKSALKQEAPHAD